MPGIENQRDLFPEIRKNQKKENYNPIREVNVQGNRVEIDVEGTVLTFALHKGRVENIGQMQDSRFYEEQAVPEHLMKRAYAIAEKYLLPKKK